VIDLNMARRRRGLSPAPSTLNPSPDRRPAVEDEALPPLDADPEALAQRVHLAMRGWAGDAIMSESDLEGLLPSLISDVQKDPEMQKPSGVARVDRALESRFGDARIGRVALMTPQELLDLDGVGRSSLDQVIAELARHATLSVPELVCGRGKATLREESDLPELCADLLAEVPGYAALM
jgi:hypothetical protein